MSTQIFVNLPIKDLNRSVDFFTKLGYKFNPQFTNENATCMIISDNIFVMLLVEKFFKGFIPGEIANTANCTESIICLSAESREQVDEIIHKAVKAGGITYNEPQDHGFMYGHGYRDLDGHLWEVMWMNQSEVPQAN
jgi:predicted lactoylglutathione lyase